MKKNFSLRVVVFFFLSWLKKSIKTEGKACIDFPYFPWQQLLKYKARQRFILTVSSLCALFITVLQVAYCQQNEEKRFYLLKSDWTAVKDMKNASYFMQLLKDNDSMYTCRYYNKFGPMVRQEVFLDSGLTIPNGRFCWYDTKGNLDSTAWVCKGRKTKWASYDDSLKPYLTVIYANGRIIERRDYRSNMYVDATGSITSLDEKEKAEQGGLPADSIVKNNQHTQAIFSKSEPDKEWNDYLKKNIKLPDRFLSIFKTGIYPVIISFSVNKQGNTEDIYLTHSCEWSADAEVFKAIRESPVWQPAVKSGDKTAGNEEHAIVTFAPAYQSNEPAINNILPVSFNSVTITQGSLNTGKFIDTASFYKKIQFKDNFFAYINGNWIISHPLPESKHMWSNFDILDAVNLERLNGLYQDAVLHAPENSPERLLGDLYFGAMDTVLIESKGYSPIKEELQQLESLENKNNILEKIAQLRSKDGINGCLFNFTIKEDDRNPNKYLVTFYQSGISLPDIGYYLNNDGRSQYVRNAYLEYINDMFKLTGFSKKQASQKAEKVLELETAISNALVTGDEITDPEKAYHKFQINDFIASTKLDWVAVLNNLQVNATLADSVLVNSPSYFRFIDNLITNHPLEDWIAYLQWKLISNAAPYLASAIVNRSFAFSKILSGQKEESPRWLRMTNMVDDLLHNISGKLFVERYFSDSAKQKVTQMVHNLQNAFAERIKKLSWMSDNCKQVALEKLYTISKNIGCSEDLSNYKGLVIQRDDFAGNIRRIKNWYYQSMIDKLNTSEPRERYSFSASTVNAFYNPQENGIFLPAGILQPPFFNITADDAINYGAIGSVIGHELTHGFDSRGSHYDKDGRLFNWWNKEDASNFHEKVNEIIDQYGKLKIDEGIYVNGASTIDENIADLGGLAIAYDAFKKTAQGQSAALIDGLSPDRRFFISYAQLRRSSATPETIYQNNLIDSHPINMFRCNIPLSNLSAFYQTFDIQKGDDMFKSANKRTEIW